jgi:hypothetical protein
MAKAAMPAMRGAGCASREETAMSKQAIVKLCMGPGGKQSRRSAILGGKVIADYVSTDDSQRYVVIERSVAKAPAAKKAVCAINQMNAKAWADVIMQKPQEQWTDEEVLHIAEMQKVESKRRKPKLDAAVSHA